ncbi:MAG: homogentisate 1,2-dioxygenase [Deltaproteobacteria bacterium]|nr:MAG: homogentisate 1,2-dioxygenase [Deltaproteobacteria bacterium]
MLDRMAAGRIPAKHHIVARDEDGALLHEEAHTRNGFDGPYTLMYHRHEPHRHTAWRLSERYGWSRAERAPDETERPLLRRHFKSFELPQTDRAPIEARTPIVFNNDIVVTILRPGASDPVYFANGDGDDLYFVQKGGGTLRSVLGDLEFTEKDYIYVPRALKHRFVLPEDTEQYWLHFEIRNELFVPKQWRTPVGQLRMDAPYCHRDFTRPTFRGYLDEGLRTVVMKREDRFTEFDFAHTPLDVVGWDGAAYPFLFPILNFQPRAGLVHLPPDWHGTFAFKGGIVCSFVPRVVDFHEEAIPCPYPHEAVHCDEILFYSEGNFVSRRGISSGSVSFHPAGVMHGPHPGAYEASIGHRRTDELAVMMDTFAPLHVTRQARELEDEDYHASWCP